jgi:hypothetical protein
MAAFSHLRYRKEHCMVVIGLRKLSPSLRWRPPSKRVECG